jgi:hypothetical protein
MLLDASISTPQNSQETYPQHPMNPGQPLQLPALFTAKSNVRALAKAKIRVVARSMWRGLGSGPGIGNQCRETVECAAALCVQPPQSQQQQVYTNYPSHISTTIRQQMALQIAIAVTAIADCYCCNCCCMLLLPQLMVNIDFDSTAQYNKQHNYPIDNKQYNNFETLGT